MTTSTLPVHEVYLDRPNDKDNTDVAVVTLRGGSVSIRTIRRDGTFGTRRPRTREESEAVPLAVQGRHILASPQFWAIASQLPGNRCHTGKPGKPANYPAWVYLFLAAMTTAYGSQRAAITQTCMDPHAWKAYRRYAHKHLPVGWDRAPKQAPKRHHLAYFLRKWKSSEWAKVRSQTVTTFRIAATNFATSLGHLPEGQPLYYRRPCPSQWVSFDGTVYPGPTNNRRVKGRRDDTASGWHNKFGTENAQVWGSKIVFASVRSEDYHGRIILDFEHVLGPNENSGIGDEGRAIVTVAKRIHHDAPGMRGVIVDGVLRHIHIAELAATNLHTINWPAAGSNPDRATKGTNNPSRMEKRKKVGVFRHTRTNGRECEHDIWAIGGQLHEKAPSGDDGKPVWVPLPHTRVSTRANDDGTYRHYIHANVRCIGKNVPLVVPLHHHPRVGATFKRGEYLRFYPPGSLGFGALYGRRNDTESLHNEMKRTMKRLPAYGAEGQQLFILGFALRHNAVTEALTRNTT